VIDIDQCLKNSYPWRFNQSYKNKNKNKNRKSIKSTTEASEVKSNRSSEKKIVPAKIVKEIQIKTIKREH